MVDLPGLSCNVVGNIPSLTHSIKRDTIANTELNTIEMSIQKDLEISQNLIVIKHTMI
jgi:hypothetical protein